MNRFLHCSVSPRGFFRRASGLAGLSLVAFAGAVLAQPIAVPNGSFESPVPQPGFPATPFLDNWQETPEPDGFDPGNFGGLTWNDMTGAFPNPGFLVLDGQQAGYMFSLAGVGLSQSLSTTYQAGLSYELTVGIHPGLSGQPLPGDIFRIQLSYLNGSSLIPITSTAVIYDAGDFPDVSLFYDHRVSLPTVQPGDAWAGRQIGIEFISETGFGTGTWDIDNVRLTAVPEPSTVTLVAVGLGGYWFVRARARRKA